MHFTRGLNYVLGVCRNDFIAKDVVSALATILNSNKEKESVKSTSSNECQCVLSESEKKEIREIFLKLFGTRNISGYSILKQALIFDNTPRDILDIIRFFAENKFFDDVKSFLVQGESDALGLTLSLKFKEEVNEIINMLPEGDQEYIRGAYYTEYGYDGCSCYQYYIIGGKGGRAS